MHISNNKNRIAKPRKMALLCGFSHGARDGDIALATLIDREKSTSIEMLLELEIPLLLSDMRISSWIRHLLTYALSALRPKNSPPDCFLNGLSSPISFLNLHEKSSLDGSHFHGARDGTRTHDLLITNQLRYQLRHSSRL